jgi:hypothetical protein
LEQQREVVPRRVVVPLPGQQADVEQIVVERAGLDQLRGLVRHHVHVSVAFVHVRRAAAAGGPLHPGGLPAVRGHVQDHDVAGDQRDPVRRPARLLPRRRSHTGRTGRTGVLGRCGGRGWRLDREGGDGGECRDQRGDRAE